MIENLICEECGIRDDGVKYYSCVRTFEDTDSCVESMPLCFSCMKSWDALGHDMELDA